MTHSHDTADEGLVQAFSQAAMLMDVLLQLCTGVAERERKKLVYYTLATHSIAFALLFSLAVLRGVQGTGKSWAMRIARLFAYNPLPFNAQGSTLPVFRDFLTAAHGGTAVIEEADSVWKGNTWFESLLSDRYHRDSAKVALKVPGGDGGYVTQEKPSFGASIVHRRTPFKNSALEGRSIIIRFRPVHGGDFLKMGKDWESQLGNDEAVSGIQGVTFQLPPIGQPPGQIDGRIWDTYGPVLGVARILGDSEFEEEMIEEMEVATMTLREGQAMAELEPIAVRMLIQCISENGKLNFGKGVLLNKIGDTIEKNEGIKVNSFQLGAIFNELAFEKHKSHGYIKVYPSPAKLVEVCTLLGIEDEAIEELAKKLKSKNG